MPQFLARQTIMTSVAATLCLAALLAACSGPDEFGDAVETPVPTATSTSTTQPSSAATATVAASPTPAVEVTPTTDDATETTTQETPDTDEGTATADGTPAAEETPGSEATSSPGAESTAAQEVPGGMDALPLLEELPQDGYIIADQGERSDEQLARAYADPTAHLLRLEEWGFRQHVYREFTRQAGDDDPRPGYVLATVNVYGSPEQADIAFQWLEDLQLNQGARTADAPVLGDGSVAITVTTQQGEPTASVYVRDGASTYIYYAEGGDPLPHVTELAERVFERIGDEGRRAESEWPG